MKFYHYKGKFYDELDTHPCNLGSDMSMVLTCPWHNLVKRNISIHYFIDEIDQRKKFDDSVKLFEITPY